VKGHDLEACVQAIRQALSKSTRAVFDSLTDEQRLEIAMQAIEQGIVPKPVNLVTGE